MESTLNFINKFTDVVRNHIEETSDCLGKEVVDNNAVKAGICIDKVKIAYGAKFSMLEHNYSPEIMKQLEAFDEDVLICQGKKGVFFVPMSEVEALGSSLILVNSTVNQPENGTMGRKREEVFRKFYKTKNSIKSSLPQVESKKSRSRNKRRRLRIFY